MSEITSFWIKYDLFHYFSILYIPVIFHLITQGKMINNVIVYKQACLGGLGILNQYDFYEQATRYP